MKSFEGYLKLKLGDDYILLADGNHKAISDFLLRSGGTLTGAINFTSTNARLTFGALTTSPITNYTAPALGSNGVGIYSRYGNSRDEGAIIITEDTAVIYNSSDVGWGFQVHDKDRSTDMTVNYYSSDNSYPDEEGSKSRIFGVRETGVAYAFGGFLKRGSSNSYVLLGGGGHKALSDFKIGDYLPLSGGTLTGLLHFQLGNSNDTYIGHYNASWMHFVSPVPFYFSTNVSVNGDITQYSTGYTWIHSGNISSQSVNYATSAGSATTASQVKDAGNNTAITFKYSSGGFTSNPSWLGAWNGYQLTYVSPSVLTVANATNCLSIAQVSEEQDTDSAWGQRYAESHRQSLVYNTLGREWAYWIGMRSSDVTYGTILRLSHDGLVQFCNKAGGGAGENWSEWKDIITSSNIGSQSVNYASSAGNADTVDGYHATCSNTPFGTIPVIVSNGWMDVGNSFEMHYDNTTGSDFSTRLYCTGNHSNSVALPSASGTLALTSDLSSYLPKSSSVSDYNTWNDSDYGFSEWTPAQTGRPEDYGTSLNFKDPSTTWYYRLMFGTSGRIYHRTGINTTSLSQVGTIAYLSDISWSNVTGKPTLLGAINYNNNSNSTYQVLWGSGDACYGTAGIYVNPYYSYVYATSFYTTSDRSKKQNISEFSEHIRKFQMRDTEKWHYGVIAQEVPEMFRDGEEGSMTVNYNSVLSYYIGILENKINQLELKIKYLENK